MNRKAAGRAIRRRNSIWHRRWKTARVLPRTKKKPGSGTSRQAMQEVAAAQLRLARIYARETPQQCRKAIEWYGRAASSGEAAGHVRTGQALSIREMCDSRARPTQSSYTWFVLAGRFGSAQGKMEAEILGSALTPVQKRNADQTAERWIEEIRCGAEERKRRRKGGALSPSYVV